MKKSVNLIVAIEKCIDKMLGLENAIDQWQEVINREGVIWLGIENADLSKEKNNADLVNADLTYSNKTI